MELDPRLLPLLLELSPVEDTAGLLQALVERLRAEGVPLWRVACGLRLLHPLIHTLVIDWRADRGTIRELPFTHGINDSPLYRRSPIAALDDGETSIRCRMLPGDPEPPYPLLSELRRDGATDYLAQGIACAEGATHAITWSTDAPGGFSEADLALLEGVRRVLPLLIEGRIQRYVARAVVNTYLGRGAGERVLAGRIQRGDCERIQAVLWFSDLRGFTALSERLPQPELLALLNASFDLQVAAIHAHGGEVLKFMGDGLLAIFREDQGEAAACRAALAAARRVMAALAAGELATPLGLALHRGEVAFGNIGAPDRLDFTVIGPAVNLASRLEGLCAPLRQPLLVSAAVAGCWRPGETWTPAPLGAHPLRGLHEAQEVFAISFLEDPPPPP